MTTLDVILLYTQACERLYGTAERPPLLRGGPVPCPCALAVAPGATEPVPPGELRCGAPARPVAYFVIHTETGGFWLNPGAWLRCEEGHEWRRNDGGKPDPLVVDDPEPEWTCEHEELRAANDADELPAPDEEPQSEPAPVHDEEPDTVRRPAAEIPAPTCSVCGCSGNCETALALLCGIDDEDTCSICADVLRELRNRVVDEGEQGYEREALVNWLEEDSGDEVGLARIERGVVHLVDVGQLVLRDGRLFVAPKKARPGRGSLEGACSKCGRKRFKGGDCGTNACAKRAAARQGTTA